MEPHISEGRILLIDDLALFRRIFPERLRALGLEIVAVGNVPEARQWLAASVPELILLDVIMPGVDGFSYCRELKADPATRDIPVIMLTDLGGNVFERCLEAGADDYVPKRAPDAYLRIRIKGTLQLRAQRLRTGGSLLEIPSSSLLLASPSPMLRAQLPAQFASQGHVIRSLDTCSDLVAQLRPEDHLLILDMALGLEEILAVLPEIRAHEQWRELPVLVLCESGDLHHLDALEPLVDDILWKPMPFGMLRHRLQCLLELGFRKLRA